MRVLVTGGSGVLGRAARPLLLDAGHEVDAPAHRDLDLFDPEAVAAAVSGAEAILHLATRIPVREGYDDAAAWRENDRLRTEASRILVDAALGAPVEVYVQASVAFVYPPDGRVDEETPIVAVPDRLRSVLDAEEEAARFAAPGRRGVVLRFGLLDGPGTGNDSRNGMLGSTLHVHDAGRALVVALSLRSGIYNAVRDGERVSNERLERASGWRPER